MQNQPSTRSTFRVLGCVVGSLMILAGCSASGDGTASKESVSPVSAAVTEPPVLSDDDSFPPGQTGQLVPGLYAVLGTPTPEQQFVLDNARYTYVKKCMKDQGFTLVDAPPTQDSPTRSKILFDGYIGILDADYAKANGYQLNLDSIEQAHHYDIGKNQTYPNKEYEYALKVSGDGGCLAQAEQALNQGRPSEDQSTPLLGKIYQDSLKATFTDPGFLAAVELWSSCMKSAGYDYATPHDAFTAYDGFQLTAKTALRKKGDKASNEPPHPSATEVDTAMTDVECKRSSRVADIYRSVFWNKQLDSAKTKKNQSTLAVLDQITDRLLSNAHQILQDAKG